MPTLNVLTAPYGTNLKSGTRRCISDKDYKKEITSIAQTSFNAGSDAFTTDTFPLGSGNKFDAGEFAEQMEAHVAWASHQSAAHRGQISRLLFSLRPFGDCYRPEEAPDLASGKDFHELRFSLLPDHQDGTPSFEILLETVCTGREALGAALAYVQHKNRLEKSKRGKKLTTSFVVDKYGHLFDGTPVHEVIEEVMSHPGTGDLRFGINCSGLPGTTRALELARKHGVDKYITTIYPNASDSDVRQLEGSETIIKAEDLGARAEEIIRLAQAHPHIHTVGGCCGCESSFMRGLRKRLNSFKSLKTYCS